nr:RNA-directed DNA polymerase, eukaryota [Tanacetum cinerariifolium]
MIFKVDFEKAYDSVRWDFIDDILRRFSFREKWCKWIQSCLYSSWGLVLVYGSPTKEFQFHKGAILIYHMSIFKVPVKVRWKSVLAAKDVGGLGVSSLFALNRALMFKWVWWFFSQKNLLWVRVVKALHGEDRKIGKKVQPRFLSNHRSIIMRDDRYDYGPIPFKFFHYWFELDGFAKLVEQAWLEANVNDKNSYSKFMNKLKYLKEKILIWTRLHKESLNSRKSILKVELADLDEVIDKEEGSDANGHRRREVVRLIQEVEKVDAMEVAQKAKIKWSIKGDENSKYSHGVLNKKRGHLTIRGVLVDFEKAYDSVRWDFINDILRRFGFGEKWCKWIQSCLYSSRGSVLVNGSPTEEFQFHKGLFNEIKLDSSLQISHLFYYDDSIFMGQWSQCNIDTIIGVSNVFFRTSGLRVNMNKSNLMGISVDSNKVKHAAMKIGASKYGIYSCVFFNGADVNSKKPSWVRWKSVLAAKDVGNSLWVRVVKALHSEDEKIAWCGDIAFKKLVPRLYALESMKNIEVASKLSKGGLKFSFRHNPRGGVEQAQFERLKEMVEGVTLSNLNDRWSWSLVGSGDFSVSSVRKLIDNAILPKGISKTRWIKEVPIKINVHA